MSSFSHAKVLVLDDNWEDGSAMLRSLWNLGIGALYLTGQEEKLPKLTGVRLAILDIDLGMKFTGVSEPVSILQRVIDEANGPYVAIIWTGVEEEIHEFREELQKLKPDQRPFYLKSLVKKNYQGDAQYDLDLIESELSSILNSLPPFDIFVEWEGKVSKSASNTLFEIGKLAQIGITHELYPSDEYPINGDLSEEIKRWLLTLRIILARLTMETIDSINKSEKELILSIVSTLKPLLLDRIDIEMEDFNDDLLDEIILRILDAISKEKQLTGKKFKAQAKILPFAYDFSSQLNQMLHLGEPFASVLPFPGNVFNYSDAMKNIDCDKFNFAPIDNLIAEGFRETSGAEFDEIRKRDTRLLLEITPECDYIQNKVTNSRFVAGFFLPKRQLDDTWRNPTYCYSLGPVPPYGFADIKEQGYLIFNLHYIITIPHEMAKGLTPIFRMKRQFLTSLQTLLGSNISRQGILRLDTK